MKFLAVDMGASATRFACEDQTIRLLPNNMVFVEPEESIHLKKNSDDLYANLDVSITKDGVSDFFPCRALIGELANRESASNVRPSGLKNKSDQKVNYVSIITALAVSMLVNGEQNEQSVDVFVALPPAEATVAQEKVKANLLGHYTVNFARLGTQVSFTIKDVDTYEESFLAMLSFFFNKDCTPKAEAKEFGTGNLLSLDIGASTTDLVIVENMKYLEKSGQTYKTGGNVAVDILSDLIREEYGYDIPFENACTAMAEGRMVLGNGYEDISGLVRQAKKRYARDIVQNIQNYFRKVNIPIQTIRAIMVSGGGSMQSQYINEKKEQVVTVPPMSEFITEYIKDICENVVVRTYNGNPRTANITGLLTRVNLEMKRRGAAARSGANTGVAGFRATTADVTGGNVVGAAATNRYNIQG